MKKTDAQKDLVSVILSTVIRDFESMEPCISVCELAKRTGIERRTLARYLNYGSKIDLPFASLIIICNAIGSSLVNVIPFGAVASFEGDVSLESLIKDIGNTSLTDMNDCLIDFFLTEAKSQYPEGTLYRLVTQTEIDLSDRGLRKAFKQKDGHYPLLSTTAALKLLDALNISISSRDI